MLFNIRYVFCNKLFKAFIKQQMSKEKRNPLLVIKNLLLWWDELSSFLTIAIFFCKVFILYKCNYKLLVKSSVVLSKKTNDVNGI